MINGERERERKRERERRGAESNVKLPHLSIPSKTADLAPEFAVEDLSLSRTTALVPEIAAKDLPMGRILDDDDANNIKN